MPAPNNRSSSSRRATRHNSPVPGKMIEDDIKKEQDVRHRSSKKSRSHCGRSSLNEKNPVDVDESCNAKNLKKSKKSSRRTRAMSCDMVREYSSASFADSLSGSSTSTQLTASSSLSRSRRSAISLTNRLEMASILDSIRAQRDERNTIAQSSASAIKMKLDEDFEKHRQAILLKWKAMDKERKSRTCLRAQPFAMQA